MTERIENIKKLSQQILKQSKKPTITIYLLNIKEEQVQPNTINRIFGAPIGINDQSWPRYENMADLLVKDWDGDTRMDHVFTVDLKGLDVFHPENTRAMAFFLSDTEHNTAYDPFTDEVKVVFLSEQDLQKGEYKGNLPKKMPNKVSTFEVIPIKVPRDVFKEDIFDEGNNKMRGMKELQDVILNWHARIGGAPIFIQSYDLTDEDHFIMQFDEHFANINLSDNGVMYLFAETAFWQCA